MTSSHPHQSTFLFTMSQILSVSALLVMWLGAMFWVWDSILATFSPIVQWVTQSEGLESFLYYQDSSGLGRMALLLWMLLIAMGLYGMGLIDYLHDRARWKLWMGPLSVLSVWVHIKVVIAVVQVLFL